jgi:hypothetical protein
VPLVEVAVVVFGVTILAAVLGVRAGRRRQAVLSDQERSQLFAIQASLLGLLALLLGFSFGMGQSRYDLRRRLLLDEANAIGTARLRAATVSEGVGAELEQHLQAYVDSRLAIVRAQKPAAIKAAVAESERLQHEIWSRAARLAKEEPRSIPVGLLLQALNDMIDLHTLRLGAATNHIPPAVLVVLVLVAVAAMGWVGAGFGSTGHWGMVTTLILSALIACVITVIVDLDQPRTGLIRIDQTAMMDLKRGSP